MVKMLFSLVAALMCCVAFADEAKPEVVNKGGKDAFAETLMGNTSVFLECGQSDVWTEIESMKKRAALADADVAVAMANILDKTASETNAARRIIRAGAAMMLGKYGSDADLPLLRKISLSKDDPAATKAFQSYMSLASQDKVLGLVDETYGDVDSKSYRRVRGLFFWHAEKKVKDGVLADEEKTQLVAFMRKHVASESDVRDVLEIDGVLSALDREYASSRERAINIGRALNSGRAVTPLVLSNTVERLKSARDLILEADRRKSGAPSGGGAKESGK